MPMLSSRCFRFLPSFMIALVTSGGIVKAQNGPSNYLEVIFSTTLNTATARPPSLGSQAVVVYENPKGITVLGDSAKASVQPTYFVKPMLLPNWNEFSKNVNEKCAGVGEQEQVAISFQVEFTRDVIMREIASELQIPIKSLLTTPYAWISIHTGANSRANGMAPQYPERSILEFPPGAKTLEKRALLRTLPDKQPAYITAPCSELKYLSEQQDISGQFFAPTKDVQTNVFTLVLRNFIELKQVADLTRKETQTGGQEIQTLSSGGGVGLNLGGHIGMQGFSNNGKSSRIDTTSRLITANVVADLAQQFAKSVTVTYWREHGGSDDELKNLANMLVDFVLGQSAKVEASFLQGQDKTWTLAVGNTVLRSLSNEQMKQLVETSTNPKLNFTEKSNASFEGVSAGADKTFNGTDETKIKYTEDTDHKWVPTGITLYALSSGTLKESFDARIVEYLAKDGGLALDYVEPVLKTVVPGTDLSDVIKSEINNLGHRVNTLVPSVLTPNPANFLGFDTSAKGTNKDCPPGQVVSGAAMYLEGALKIALKCSALSTPATPLQDSK